jgi:hypothetical protein
MDSIEDLNKLVEVPHEFDVDLNCLALANLRFALEGITQAEDKERAALEGTRLGMVWDVAASLCRGNEFNCPR